MDNDKCWCECKNPKEHNACKTDYIWNPAICSCENGKYMGNIIDDSLITCDRFINAEWSETLATQGKLHDEETKTILTNFN